MESQPLTDQDERQRRILDLTRKRGELNERLGKLPTNDYTPRRGNLLREIGAINRELFEVEHVS